MLILSVLLLLRTVLALYIIILFLSVNKRIALLQVSHVCQMEIHDHKSNQVYIYHYFGLQLRTFDFYMNYCSWHRLSLMDVQMPFVSKCKHLYMHQKVKMGIKIYSDTYLLDS